MANYEEIKRLNQHLPFYHIEDREFRPFGKVLKGYEFQELIDYMETTTIPKDQNQYVASVQEMEYTTIKEQLQAAFYGNMPIQIGYCNGPNSTLNGFEYHKGSEINVAATDMVLLLGQVQDIEGNSYSSARAAAFFIPKGTAVELYSTTLHFAPCKVNKEGFKTVVILPAGTNGPLNQTTETRTEEDQLLFMKNKWLLVHPEREVLVNKGAHPGIKGENVRIYL